MASKVANSPAERKLAYAILHRHGHRAPARNLGPEAEALRWQAFLAPHDELYRYKEKYKVKLHPSNPVARDMSAPPFGALTSKGFQHMVGVGRSIAQQFPALASPRSVTTFATNYNRTQLSAQAVLAGLDYPACDVTVRHVPSCALSMQERNPALAATVRKRVSESLSRPLTYNIYCISANGCHVIACCRSTARGSSSTCWTHPRGCGPSWCATCPS